MATESVAGLLKSSLSLLMKSGGGDYFADGVATPGGITSAGLEHLQTRVQIENTIHAATRRASEFQAEFNNNNNTSSSS